MNGCGTKGRPSNDEVDEEGDDDDEEEVGEEESAAEGAAEAAVLLVVVVVVVFATVLSLLPPSSVAVESAVTASLASASAALFSSLGAGVAATFLFRVCTYKGSTEIMSPSFKRRQGNADLRSCVWGREMSFFRGDKMHACETVFYVSFFTVSPLTLT